MSASTTRSYRPVAAKSTTASSHPTANRHQAPLIFPGHSLDSGESTDVTGARSFVTQIWTIPDRPKPGRKPKQPIRKDSKQLPQRSDQARNHAIDSSTNPSSQKGPPTVIEDETESTIESKDLVTNAGPEALQQAYINSLEAKIDRLQTQQSEQAKYYKSLATQSTSKLSEIQNENKVLKSQVNVLRDEVLRLRKQNSQLVKKSTSNITSTSTVIEGKSNPEETKVRKQVSNDEVERTSFSTAICIKKPRHQPEQSEAKESKSHVSPPSKTTQTVTKTISEIYLVEDSRSLALEPHSSTSARVPDFTSNDIYCGLCTSELDCVCRQVGLKPPLPSIDPLEPNHANNLLALPIRRRSKPLTNSIWRLVTEDDPGSPVTVSFEMDSGLTRECSGNPQDCPACRDDPFGQAFCTALNQADESHKSQFTGKSAVVSTTGSSSTTTKQIPRSDPVLDAYTSIPCCGDPGLCGSQNCYENSTYPTAEKISCSEAWRQLKVHPNIGLANLQLLADVVARKSTPYTSSSTAIDSEPPLIDHAYNQSHSHQSLSQSSNGIEDASFSPHVTLSKIFENVHADLDDDYQLENPTSQSNFSSQESSNDHFDDTGNLVNHRQQKHTLTDTTNNSTTLTGRRIKFVEKESLDQALRMLDGANHRT